MNCARHRSTPLASRSRQVNSGPLDESHTGARSFLSSPETRRMIRYKPMYLFLIAIHNVEADIWGSKRYPSNDDSISPKDWTLVGVFVQSTIDVDP